MDCNANLWGKSLIRTMATFFLRIRSRFSYKLNKISWELPGITSPTNPKTSDYWNTEIFPIPTAISTKTGPFELKYKGRKTRNTQVCRHTITAYVYLSYMSSCARPISEKLVFEPFLKSGFSILLVISTGNNILVYFGPRWSPEVPKTWSCSPWPSLMFFCFLTVRLPTGPILSIDLNRVTAALHVVRSASCWIELIA